MSQREVVILSGVRTAIGDYGGSLKDVPPSELGAKVVIEGIETFDQFIACRDTGAHWAQGYFLARPGFPLPKVTDSVQRLAFSKRAF